MVGRRQSNALFLREPLSPPPPATPTGQEFEERTESPRVPDSRFCGFKCFRRRGRDPRLFACHHSRGHASWGLCQTEFLSHRTQKAQDGISSR